MKNGKKTKNQSHNGDEPDNEDWEQIGRSTVSTTNKSSSDFNALNTVEQLVGRPKQEFVNALTANREEIDNRIEIKPIILKNVPPTSPAYVAFQEFVQEEKFISEVPKSNVNKWIIRNLTKQTA